MDELNFTFKMPDDETLAKYISIKGEKGEKGDPTKLSELENDTGFVTASTDALANYYTKSQTDTALNSKVDNSTLEAIAIPDSFFTGEETIAGSGTFIELENTADAVIKDIKLYGDTQQNGTPTASTPVNVEVVTGTQAVIISDGGQRSQSYTVALGDIELCKIGNYQDYIYKSGGLWYIHKEIGSITLTGGEDWRGTGASAGNPFFSVNTIQAIGNYCDGYCTHFVNRKGYPSSNGYFAIRADGTSISCYNSAIEALSDWLTWLEENTPEVYYPLAIATDVAITDTALITQLENIIGATSYSDTTVIAISGALSAILTVEAYKNNWSGTVAGVNSGLDVKADKKVVAQKPYYFDSVSEMQVYDLEAGDMAETLGYYTANDGGAGTYKIIDSDATVDGGSIIALNNGLNAQLIVNGEVNVKQFGAKGDNSTDDTEAIQNAINFAKSKVIPVYVPTGTYLISQIVLDYQHAVLYGNSRKSVLRSINNNTADSIVKFSERGILGSIIRDIYIHGNKENNSNVYDGLLFTSDNEYGDSYALIDNVEVVSCTGNGVNLNESRIREIRMSNTRSAWNLKNGFRIYRITDSMFYNCTAATNQECGFYIVGSNHKITGCKAHTNGAGDGVTIDQERSPASAYEETEDTSPQTGKTYYTRSGSGYNDDPYVFTVFSGSSFDASTTYYELVTTYLKRYYGFYLEGKENTLSTCEAQDNLGDGYYVNGGNNSLVGVLADNNGRIGHQISYEDAGLEQIYDGVHIEPWGTNNVVGTFANFRYDRQEGQCQRAGLCVKASSGGCNASIITDHQNYDVLVLDQGYNTVNNISVNGEEFYDEYDLSRLTLISNDYSIYSGTNNASFLKKRGNRKYLRLIIRKSTDYVTDDDITLLTLPTRFRPKNLVTLQGIMSSAAGYNVRGTAQIYISSNGAVQFRGCSYASKDLVIQCEYD